MTTGNHYFFKIKNLFRQGEVNVLSLYNIAHFELNGGIRQRIKESVFALTNSTQHKNKKNGFINEIVIGIPNCHLIKSSELTVEESEKMIKGFRADHLDRSLDNPGILICLGETVLPNDHYTCIARLHISHDYFYLTCIEKIIPEDVPLYFQSNIMDINTLDFGSRNIDIPINLLEV